MTNTLLEPSESTDLEYSMLLETLGRLSAEVVTKQHVLNYMEDKPGLAHQIHCASQFISLPDTYISIDEMAASVAVRLSDLQQMELGLLMNAVVLCQSLAYPASVDGVYQYHISFLPCFQNFVKALGL
jgi:hypothetical protein